MIKIKSTNYWRELMYTGSIYFYEERIDKNVKDMLKNEKMLIIESEKLNFKRKGYILYIFAESNEMKNIQHSLIDLGTERLQGGQEKAIVDEIKRVLSSNEVLSFSDDEGLELYTMVLGEMIKQINTDLRNIISGRIEKLYGTNLRYKSKQYIEKLKTSKVSDRYKPAINEFINGLERYNMAGEYIENDVSVDTILDIITKGTEHVNNTVTLFGKESGNAKILYSIDLLYNSSSGNNNENKDKDKEGCFIATAAFGSPMTQELYILRKWRDEQLLNTYIGKMFVRIYYLISPPIAKFIEKSDKLRSIVRFFLNHLIAIMKKKYK